MIPCKGCTGRVDFVPLAEVKKENYYYAGPALVHYPWPPCQWFTVTGSIEIKNYISDTKNKEPLLFATDH